MGEAIACPEDNAIYEEAARTSVEMVTVKTVPEQNEKKEINKQSKPEVAKKPAKPPAGPVKGPKKEGIWSSLTTLPLVQQLANSIGMGNG